ncbi:hypothetical protein Psuf_050850 [Phytohabitans suffuscus]|uniref:Ricin B lectin domain-containing protein n=1 Tax=Phytohabitans suffuscus TaxID=624315 RepID=A0A6F8YNS1_9ACTN|nr:RICIN domain-containing protein [Phytohabitans suffuscus]BCB87772.1 hypothetical protein Psuf_050850 [Phytohabitans suffuscus]
MARRRDRAAVHQSGQVAAGRRSLAGGRAGGETAATPSAYTIVDRSSGECLEAAGGAGIRQWSWLDNTCQQWQLQPV